jgi:cAMP-dependent protein kinase regulator
LYIVSEGILKCSKLFSGKTEETYLRDYNVGEVFGELSLFYNTPRAASITSSTDSVLFSLDRSTFNFIVK